jgi:hypothetical protein
VTIARRPTTALQAISAPLSPVPQAPFRPGSISVPSGDVPAAESIAPVGRLRRCVFRRIDRLEALPGRVSMPSYEVMCLYRGLEEAMALGDVDGARPTCDACTATGIFRPDEA